MLRRIGADGRRLAPGWHRLRAGDVPVAAWPGATYRPLWRPPRSRRATPDCARLQGWEERPACAAWRGSGGAVFERAGRAGGGPHTGGGGGSVRSGHYEEADGDAAVSDLLGAAVELEQTGGAAEGRKLAMRRVSGMGGSQQLAGDLEGEHGKAERADDRLEPVEGGAVLAALVVGEAGRRQARGGGGLALAPAAEGSQGAQAGAGLLAVGHG